MPRPQVIVINGPAGVGKTTISRALQGSRKGTICIAGDDIRHFAPDNIATVLGPGSTYRAGAALVSSYLRMGARRVIFEYVFTSSEQIDLFRSSIDQTVDVHVFTLWAPLQIVVRREATREGREPLGERVHQTHAEMEASLPRLGTVVPNEGDPAALVDQLEQLIADQTP